MLSTKDLVFKERLVKKLIGWYISLYIIEKIVFANIIKLRLLNLHKRKKDNLKNTKKVVVEFEKRISVVRNNSYSSGYLQIQHERWIINLDFNGKYYV